MTSPSLWSRIKRARIVQVLAVYLGASWVILQVVDVLQEALALPDWLAPVCVVLLLVGLIIIVATAWVQSLPTTTRGERAGLLPGTWSVAPRDLGRSLRAGRLPHLTWARALLGGLVAFWFVFGLAGLYVVIKDGGESFAPTELMAEAAPTGIAVMPFSVTGDGLDLWREGMVDVLATNLDGMGGFRTIDSRTVLARWREEVPPEGSPDLATALTVASSTGAQYAVVGNLVGSPAGVRLNADLHELDSGRKLGQAWIEGPTDSILPLVGRLSVELTRRLLDSTGQQVLATPRTGGLTTESLPALRSYLEGEAAYRSSDFARAIAAYERAVDIDSTFALAWARLATGYQWLDNIGNEQGALAVERAASLADMLPVRDAVLIRAHQAIVEGDLSIAEPLRNAVRNYPDDPEAWYLLADFYYHHGGAAGLSTGDDVLDALERAVELDPTFTPYYIHLIEINIGRGNRERAGELLARYRELSGGDPYPHFALGYELFTPPEEERAAALAMLDTVDVQTLETVSAQIRYDNHPDWGWIERVARKARERTDGRWSNDLLYVLVGQGKLSELNTELRRPSVSDGGRVTWVGITHAMGVDPDPALRGLLHDQETCGEAEDPGTMCMAVLALTAAQRADRAERDRLIALNRKLAADVETQPGQQVHATAHRALADATAGFWEAFQGDPDRARRLLSEASPHLRAGVGFLTRWVLAGVLESDRPREALRVLDRMEGGAYGYARVRMGRIYETLGETERARRSYAEALERFENADPDLPHLIQARQGLERLGADRG